MNKNNLLIVGYCHLADGFLYGAEALKKHNYNIYFFPYLSYKMDKIENIEEHFVNFIKTNNIHIILWWNNSINYESFQKMYNNVDYKHILFNWDPFLYEYKKYNSLVWEERFENKQKIYAQMNYIFSCFEKEVDYFKNLHFPIYYAHPGFNKEISSYIYHKDYECDISIVCTNMYDNTNEFPDKTTNITRYNIVNLLYENRDKIKFHIYGPENFKNKYPECYQKCVSYDDCKYVFSNSKINLSIHPLILELNNEKSEQEYFSERLPQILGCQGLLMTNSNLSHILNKNTDYVYVDETTNIIEMVLNIININNKDNYNNVRKNGYNKALQHYQWEHWANIIINKL